MAFGLPLFQKAAPVLRAGAVLVQQFIVQLRTVSLMLSELVLGIFCVQLSRHIPVPADLCQNGRRRDGGTFAVPAYDELMGRLDGVPAAVVPVAVDESRIRSDGQALNGPLHGQHPGVENVHLVDLPRLHTGHAPGNRLSGDDFVQGFPLFLRQLFGVIQAGDVQFSRQDHRRRVHRPHQGAGPGLVHAADGLRTAVPRLTLIVPKFHINTPRSFCGNFRKYTPGALPVF